MSRSKQKTNIPVPERAVALNSAVNVGGHQLEPEDVQNAREVLTRVNQRWALKGGRTVVALAGATGAGKSSLFNALVGEPVAPTSALRPTTSEGTAAIWGQEPAGELLDWLGVHRRHQVAVPPEGSDLDGLVLVDLPDFDSRELDNRAEADRILERADVFIWVTDPQKYADARLHEDYLQPLRRHDAIMVVVLNQVDRLPDEESLRAVGEDLSRLIAADGAGEHEPFLTSARTSRGVRDLRAAIATVVLTNTATESRLVADLRGSAQQLSQGMGERTPDFNQDASGSLHAALKQSAGVPVVLDAVQRDYLRQSVTRGGWPFTRWLSALRPDPMRRLRLGNNAPGSAGITPADVRSLLGRSSLPTPTPAARANVELASRQLAEAAGASLPSRWAEAVIDAAHPRADNLADALDQAVISTPLRGRNPWWWAASGAAQLLLAFAAIIGLLWMAVLVVLGWIGVDTGPVSVMVGPVPLPLLLLVGGLLCGLLLAAVVRAAARVGAKRRRRRVERRLDEAVEGVAEQHVRRPIVAVLERHERTRELLEKARS